MKTVLKIWITIKVIYGRLKGWIGSLEKEKEAVKRYELGLIKKIPYKQDKFLGLQWDYQFDAVKAFTGGDCNSIHRVWQIYFSNMGFDSYLVTYIAEPFKMSHGFCMSYKDGIYYSCNYGNIHEHKTAKEAVEFVASLYESKVKCFVMQDTRWRFIDDRQIQDNE